MSRLFGSVDTEEVREIKISQLEQKIAQYEDAVKVADNELMYVVIKQFNKRGESQLKLTHLQVFLGQSFGRH